MLWAEQVLFKYSFSSFPNFLSSHPIWLAAKFSIFEVAPYASIIFKSLI